jgi:hypothetical protein
MNRAFKCAVFGILLGLCTFASADVIMPGTHRVYCNATIINTNEFPDIVVIGFNKGVGNTSRFVPKKDSSLITYYRSWFYLLWTDKAYFDSVGLANLPLDSAVAGLSKKTASPIGSRIHLITNYNSISLGYYTVYDANLLTSEEGSYTLYANGSEILVYLSQRISRFSDGTFTTETFSQPTGIMPRQGTSPNKNMHNSIFSKNGIFTFKALFTGNLDMTIIDCKGRVAASFTKACVTGYTYVTSFTGVKSGVYWMRFKSPGADVTNRLTIIR